MTLLLGRYRVEHLLGRGGFGKVYLARDMELDRLVALKILAPGDGQRSARQRFQREARLTSRFQHPNIVRLYDHGRTPEDESYIVYELIEGHDLRNLPEPPEPGQACGWIRDIAFALAELHDLGVLHRDIKPANIMVRKDDGRAVLCDFGLAIEDEHSTRYTRAGFVVGTPAYTAPEIWKGRRHDAGMDQFALAATLYELVYGTTLIPSGDQQALLAWLDGDGAVRFPPALDGRYPRLEATLRRALARDPGERFGSVEALAEALDEVVEVHVSSGEWRPPAAPAAARRRPSRRRAGRARALIAGLVALVGGGALLLGLAPPRPAAPPPTTPTAPPDPLAPARGAIRDRVARLVRDHEGIPGRFRDGDEQADDRRTLVLLDSRFELQWRGFLEALRTYLLAPAARSDPARGALLQHVASSTDEIGNHLRYLRYARDDPEVGIGMVPKGTAILPFRELVEKRLEPIQQSTDEFLVSLHQAPGLPDRAQLELEERLADDLAPMRVGAVISRVQDLFSRLGSREERSQLLDFEGELLFRHAGRFLFSCEDRRRLLARVLERNARPEVTGDPRLHLLSRSLALAYCGLVLAHCDAHDEVERLRFHGLATELRSAMAGAAEPDLRLLQEELRKLEGLASRGLTSPKMELPEQFAEVRVLRAEVRALLDRSRP